ncbi:MAG: fibronectin type III domain-containing protein [Candidatus Brocadiaceae bacterium]
MIHRRELLKWFSRIAGGLFVANVAPSIPPLTRINTAFLSGVHASDTCAEDTCSKQDNCGESDTAGHTCEQKDVCVVDGSRDCKTDECRLDISDKCENDKCDCDAISECTGDTCEVDASDSCTRDSCKEDTSGACTTDSCSADSSLKCNNDLCTSDKSGECTTDICSSDKSGKCERDSCTSDSSGECIGDVCTSDKSGNCLTDNCPSDKSGACENDFCKSDASGECKRDTCSSDSSDVCENDYCSSDSSGNCKGDSCASDKSGNCERDSCSSDSSGECNGDFCRGDSSGSCEGDICTADSSYNCTNDKCTTDASGGLRNDRCNSDYSGTCNEKDACVLDKSGACDSDVCREDKGPACSVSDTCAQDKPLSMRTEKGRRQFMQTGLNNAIKWLYRISSITLFVALVYGQSHAESVINNNNAVFFPTPIYKTSQDVNVKAPVGPFLRDCDGDGILEADVNGDGQCSGDPEVKDYNGDGTRELPDGTQFTGSYQFTCFHIPSDVAITSTGPLTIKASEEVAIFGALRLNSGAEISALGVIDNRTSAWLANAGIITLITAQSGEVDETQTTYSPDSPVPPIAHISACDPQKRVPEKPTKLTARAISDDKIIIGWKDNSNNEKGFKIERKNGDCSSKAAWQEIAKVDENVTTFTDTGLTAGSDFSYQVRSYKGADNSAYTDCAEAQTGNAGTPNAPTNFKATALTAEKVKLTWKDNSNNEKRFEIYRMAGTTTPSLLATVPANKESYTDTTAMGNGTVTSHVYYIMACNNKGCSPATNEAVVPFQPQNITGFAISSTEVYLNWGDISNNETAFEIYRKDGGCASKNPWKLVITLITNRASFNDAGLQSGKTYAYRIRAYTRSPAQPYAYGYSFYSNCFEIKTP